METAVGVASVTGKSHHARGVANEDRTRQLDVAPIVPASGRGFLYCVADGVGSAPKGMAAAQAVVDDLLRFYTDDAIPASPAGMMKLLGQTSARIGAWGTMTGEMVPGGVPWRGQPVGAAVATIAWFAPPGLVDSVGRLLLLHVGDTAAFRVRGEARRISSLHGGVGAVARFYGQDPLDIELIQPIFEGGDTLVLVSDGVWGSVPADLVAACVNEERTPQDAADRLVRAARSRGSTDDCTAMVIELVEW
jgi:serine/threonine protein phosphatase PrpC